MTVTEWIPHSGSIKDPWAPNNLLNTEDKFRKSEVVDVHKNT